jgi:proteasome assembly chaperone (PAC2) family protein
MVVVSLALAIDRDITIRLYIFFIMKTWIDRKKTPDIQSPIAIVGSQGLRSVGLVAIEHLIEEWGGEPFAEAYSTNFPVLYQGVPYAGVPGLAGSIINEDGTAEFPKANFFIHDRYIIVKGYNPDNRGQYPVAQEVVEFLKRLGTSRIITLGGFVSQKSGIDKDRMVSFCATDSTGLKTMKEKGLQVHYTGPFLGFSALVLGLGHGNGIPGVGLFGQTVPFEENPLLPDPPAAKALLEALERILGVRIDTSSMHPPEAMSQGEGLEEIREVPSEGDVSYI